VRKPAIGIINYYQQVPGRLTEVSLDALDWPLGLPAGLEGATIGDLGPQDHLLSYPQKWLWGNRLRGLRAGISLLIVEPRAHDRRQMILARLYHRRFHRVLTCDEALLASLPNAQYFVFGSTWVPDWRDKDVTKTRMLSLIASKKRRLRGHRMRHRIVRWMRARAIDADIMGGAYRPFDDKADGLAPYRYSVVIENTRQNGYFTEKLIDALLLKTVPIYWGAPDIGRFFDMEGIIECRSEQEIRDAVERISIADYQARLPAIEANRRKAPIYSDMLKSAARVIESTMAQP